MSDSLLVLLAGVDDRIRSYMSGPLPERVACECVDAITDCKSRLQDQTPDLLFVDLDSGGEDAFDFAREVKDDFMTQDVVLLALSSRGDMDTQVRCYDAGFDDFLEKPVDPLKLERKLKLTARFISDKKQLSRQAGYATQTAMSAMSSMGELGLVLQFMGKSMLCSTHEELAQEILNTLAQFDLVGAIQFRLPSGDVTYGVHGQNVPLEVSVLNHARGAGRIFQFKTHCAFNYGALTVLLKNMPITDDEKCGRIRDHMAQLAEGAAERLRTLFLERAVSKQRDDLSGTFTEVQETLEAINSNYRRITFELTQTMLEYQESLGRSFVHLGLTADQEIELTANASLYMQKMIKKQDESMFVITQLEKIANKLEEALSAPTLNTNAPTA